MQLLINFVLWCPQDGINLPVALSIKIHLIPLRIYFSKRGLAKVEIGLAKGKKQHDRRESDKTREASREVERAMKERK